jgi:uncharacterized membrane protein
VGVGVLGIPHAGLLVGMCVCARAWVGHPSTSHYLARALSLSLYMSASISLSFYLSLSPPSPLVNSSELIYVFARVPVCVRARVRLCLCVAVGGCLHACNIQVFLMRQLKRRCNPKA